MSPSEFLIICGTGFVAVFALLSILAAIMRLLVLIPTQSEKESDTAAIAAITVVMNSLFPGSRVARIEKQE